jgi:hypothetical protein
VRALSNFTVRPATESGDKRTRFGPFSSQCRAGNVKIPRGLWNEDLLRVLEGFPDIAHDDEVYARSGALEILNSPMKAWGLFEFYREQAEQLKAEREAARCCQFPGGDPARRSAISIAELMSPERPEHFLPTNLQPSPPEPPRRNASFSACHSRDRGA